MSTGSDQVPDQYYEYKKQSPCGGEMCGPKLTSEISGVCKNKGNEIVQNHCTVVDKVDCHECMS